jgi:methylphosphotriester-DNA--protein-cysteine methyltransferase
MMIAHNDITDASLRTGLKQKVICFGGNRKLKIYGTLSCASGKRMKRENRIFFYSEVQAIENGYRPCGNCMSHKYKTWMNGSV